MVHSQTAFIFKLHFGLQFFSELSTLCILVFFELSILVFEIFMVEIRVVDRPGPTGSVLQLLLTFLELMKTLEWEMNLIKLHGLVNGLENCAQRL